MPRAVVTLEAMQRKVECNSCNDRIDVKNTVGCTNCFNRICLKYTRTTSCVERCDLCTNIFCYACMAYESDGYDYRTLLEEYEDLTELCKICFGLTRLYFASDM